MCIGLHAKCPLFLSDFMKLEFSRQIFEKYSKSNFVKTVQWESSCSTRMDPQTRERQTKLIIAIRSFVNVPKNEMFTHNV